jgi:hypothetical protein
MASQESGLIPRNLPLSIFQRELAALENRLSSSFKLRRLGARKEVTEDGAEVVYDGLLSHLQYCVTGIDQPIQLPDTPIHLDAGPDLCLRAGLFKIQAAGRAGNA